MRGIRRIYAISFRAVEFTPSREGDGPDLPDLPGQIPKNEQIGTVAAKGPMGRWSDGSSNNFRRSWLSLDFCLQL